MKPHNTTTPAEGCSPFLSVPSLLRQERDMVKLYQKVIEKFRLSHPTASLQDLKFEHQKSVAGLRKFVQEKSDQPGNTPSALSSFFRRLHRRIPYQGNDSAIALLAEAEQTMRDLYRTLLQEHETDPRLLELVEFALIPRTVDNITTLYGNRFRSPLLNQATVISLQGA